MTLNLREKLNLTDKKNINNSYLHLDSFIDKEKLNILELEEKGTYIICFLSLSCRHCLDLLPSLTNLNGNFRIFINQEGEVANEIKDYFKFSFPVLGIDQRIYVDLDIENTPFLVVIKNARVIYLTENTDLYNIQELQSKYTHSK
jgi:hypothetical protein